MGWGAGRKLSIVLSNVRRVIAIEILCAVQGVGYRRPLEPAPGTAAVVDLIRRQVPPLEQDRSLTDEIELVTGLITDGSISVATGL
jgi:histidine ammonia-lyase